MRRLLLTLVALAALAAPAAAHAESTVVHRSFSFDYDETFGGFCAFDVHLVGHQDHTQTFHYSNLPDTIAPLSPGAQLYLAAGFHFADVYETWSNPANGRSVELHGVDRLMRRDFSFEGTVDPITGRLTGFLFSTDHNSYSFIATAPGGPVFQVAGHQIRHHTSIFENGIRIARVDTPFFTKGVWRDRLCQYLAG